MVQIEAKSRLPEFHSYLLSDTSLSDILSLSGTSLSDTLSLSGTSYLAYVGTPA